MRELKDTDVRLFEEIAKVKQPVLMKALYKYLKTIYNDVTCTRDYLYAKGDIPIALVAHLDTVFKLPPENIYYDRRQGVMWSPDGLGADDRAGVYIILKILKTTSLRPSIIFTTDEEMGGLGASSLVKNVKECWDKDMKYIIQLDRQGTNDCVFYDCDNDDFVQYCESFGFTEAIGSFSDISEICPAWGIAGVNLSVGYFDEHSYVETLHVAPMMATLEKVIRMLKDVDNAQKFEWIPSKYALKWGNYGYNYLNGKWDDYGSYMYGFPDDEEYPLKCEKCGKIFSEYEMFPVQSIDGKTIKYYCPDCIVDNIEWCDECGEAFEIDPANPKVHICPECRKEKEKGSKNKSWKVKSKKSKTNSVQLSATHNTSLTQPLMNSSQNGSQVSETSSKPCKGNSSMSIPKPYASN